MIATMLPVHGTGMTPYTILESVVIDGHEVAWAETTWAVRDDHTPSALVRRTTICACNFADDGTPDRCLYRQAALHLRHLRLRREYEAQGLLGDSTSATTYNQRMRHIILDLVARAEAGEWLESSDAAQSYGGLFYIQTFSAVTDVTMGSAWPYFERLMGDECIVLDGAVVKPFTPTPKPAWELYDTTTINGWRGVLKSPAHDRMPSEWRFEIYRPDGTLAVAKPGPKFERKRLYDVDASDVIHARSAMHDLLEIVRQGA